MYPSFTRFRWDNQLLVFCQPPENRCAHESGDHLPQDWVRNTNYMFPKQSMHVIFAYISINQPNVSKLSKHTIHWVYAIGLFDKSSCLSLTFFMGDYLDDRGMGPTWAIASLGTKKKKTLPNATKIPPTKIAGLTWGIHCEATVIP